MTHDLKDKAARAATPAVAPTAAKSRHGASPLRERSEASVRRDAATKSASRSSQASGAGAQKNSHRAAAPPSIHASSSLCDKQRARNFVGGMFGKILTEQFTESMMAQAVKQPVARDRTRVDKLLLSAGLLDHQLEVFTADSMGVDHSKLRRLADRDPSLIPIIGRES